MPSDSPAAAFKRYYQVTPIPMDDRSFWDRVRGEARFAELMKVVRSQTEEAAMDPPRLRATDYLAAKRHNNRNATDVYWQSHRRTLSNLAMNRCLLGIDPADPDDRLLNWLWSFLTEPTWAVSAHLPEMDLPSMGSHTLDLAATELAAMLAEMCECLRPWMDSVSNTLSDSIVSEIDRRVLIPFLEAPPSTWAREDAPHMNNWTGVCAGSILTTCESLAAQGYARPEARRRAIDLLNVFLHRAFSEHGECDEGVGYWLYGMGLACMGWSRLDRSEFERSVDQDRLRVVADYPHRAHLFDNVFFSGNDAGLFAAAPSYFVAWLEGATGLQWLNHWMRIAPETNPGHLRHFGMMLRQLALPREPEAVEETAAAIDGGGAQYLPDQQVAVFRTQTPGGELLGALSGGNNAERHNHNDLGHFIITFNRDIIIPDLGAPYYQADFFGPKRYTYLSASSRGHNCPIIAGHEQRTGLDAAARVIAYEPQAATPHFVIDLTAAYPPEAGLASWTRRLDCVHPRDDQHGMMVVVDEFRTQAPNTPITHVIWSLAHPHHLAAANQPPRLRMGAMVCELPVSPNAIELDSIDAGDEKLRTFIGKRLHRISAEYQTNDAGELRIETRFVVE